MYILSTSQIDRAEELSRYLYGRRIRYYININRGGTGRRYTFYSFVIDTDELTVKDICKQNHLKLPKGVEE